MADREIPDGVRFRSPPAVDIPRETAKSLSPMFLEFTTPVVEDVTFRVRFDWQNSKSCWCWSLEDDALGQVVPDTPNDREIRDDEEAYVPVLVNYPYRFRDQYRVVFYDRSWSYNQVRGGRLGAEIEMLVFPGPSNAGYQGVEYERTAADRLYEQLDTNRTAVEYEPYHALLGVKPQQAFEAVM